MGCGSEVRMAAIKLARLLPAKAGLPVAISYMSSPSAKMSARASASFPSNCSGAIYWNVPTIVPSRVNCAWSAVISVSTSAKGAWSDSFARPKSISLAPALVSMTFDGFRSR